MKQKGLLAGIVILGAALFFIMASSESSEKPQDSSGLERGDPLSAEDQALLRPGDIILRRGDSFASSLIVQALGGCTGFSHCGIIDGTSETGLRVSHSVSRSLSDQDGLQQESLTSFTASSIPGTTTVMRLKGGGAALASGVLPLLAQGAPFDNGFTLDPSDGLYCSELIYHLLPEPIRMQTMVYQNPGSIIRFESFLDPRYFDVIIDHRSMAE